MAEGLGDVDCIVPLRTNNSIELLAVDRKRHFDIFDLLRFSVGQQINQFLSML